MGTGTQEKLRRIAQDLTQEMTADMGFTHNPFTCSCRLTDPASRTWSIALLTNVFQGVGFDITAGEDLSDEDLRLRMKQALEDEFARAGLGKS